MTLRCSAGNKNSVEMAVVKIQLGYLINCIRYKISSVISFVLCSNPDIVFMGSLITNN